MDCEHIGSTQSDIGRLVSHTVPSSVGSLPLRNLNLGTRVLHCVWGLEGMKETTQLMVNPTLKTELQAIGGFYVIAQVVT